MTWLTGWNYRKPITISNSGSSLTDYQVLVTIDTANLISSNKLLSECEDIRFTSSDGSTLLNYWIESDCNTSSTRIWIKIPSISIGSSTIYLYYNNPSASSTSDITNVMIFGDDFSSDLSKWIGDTAYFTISNGELTNTPTSNGRIIYHDVPLTNTIITARIKTTDTSTDLLWGLGYRIDASNRAYLARRNVTPSNLRRWGDGSQYYSIIPPQWTSGTYGIDKIIVRSTVGLSIHSFNDITITGVLNFSSNINNGISIKAYGTGTPGIQYMDWVHIRKYSSTELTICFGGEEVSAVSWLSGWNRRKLITIAGSTSSPQTDYQMKLTVHKSTGTDTSTDIYTGTNINNDFSDLRFTTSDGSTLLNYWIESFSSGSIATVWIKIPSIPVSPCTTTIYIYYNKPSATSSSNGESTFVAFDDFSTNKLGTYWTGNTSSYTVSGGLLTGSGAAYQIISHAINHGTSDFLLHVETLAGGTHNISGIHDGSGNLRNTGNGIYVLDEGTGYGDCNLGKVVSSAETWISAWQSSNGNNTFEITKIGTTYTWYQNGTYKGTATIANFSQSYLQLETWDSSVWNIIYVRNFSSPEPTFSLIGAEEVLALPANITATSLIITPSATPCIAGSCSVTVDVIWTNTGGTSGSFTPSIKIDNVPVITDPVLTPVSVGPSGTKSQQFRITGLTTGTHNICPDPN